MEVLSARNIYKEHFLGKKPEYTDDATGWFNWMADSAIIIEEE